MKINPRIRYSQKNDRVVHAIDGAEFHFVPRNQASLDAALTKLNDHGLRVIAALEKHAGRPLTDRELLDGVEHVDDRTAHERVADDTSANRPRQHFDGTQRNPYARALEMGLGDPPKPETRTERYERLAQEWDDRKAAEAAASAPLQPAQARAVAHAERELMALRYDPTATVRDLRAAESRLELARSGELSAYRQADRDYRADKQARLDEKTAEVDAQIASLRQRKAEIVSATFELPTADTP